VSKIQLDGSNSNKKKASARVEGSVSTQQYTFDYVSDAMPKFFVVKPKCNVVLYVYC